MSGLESFVTKMNRLYFKLTNLPLELHFVNGSFISSLQNQKERFRMLKQIEMNYDIEMKRLKNVILLGIRFQKVLVVILMML